MSITDKQFLFNNNQLTLKQLNMEKKFSKIEIAVIKRTAQNVQQYVNKKEKLNAEIEKIKGTKKNWLTEMLDIVAPVPNSGAYIGFEAGKGDEWKLNKVKADDIFEAEAAILKEIAAEGSCIIAGRSGFHVFRNHPNHLNVFITASNGYRVARVMRKQGLPEVSAQVLVKDIDQARENYIQRYAGVSRYDVRNYDLTINAEGHSEEQMANIIMAYINN